jgi:hypothetical protein
VQANEAMVPIPVSGGQFSVDLKIQNGVVQNYGYQNNQVPTLLSPVGTISLTNATAPHILPTGSYWNFPSGNEPTANRPVEITTNLTGQTTLNDGRIAKFSDSPSILYGLATPSSPIAVSSIGRIIGGLYSALSIPELPQNYAGTIAVQVQSGSLLVPTSAFSNPSNTVSKFEINSGTINSVFNDKGGLLGKTEIDYYDAMHQKFTKVWISKYRHLTFRPDLLRSDGSEKTPITRVTLLSPMGTTSMSLQHLSIMEYDPSRRTEDWSNFKKPTTVSAVASGTITLMNGTVVNVSNRLISFDLDKLTYSPFIYDESLTILITPSTTDLTLKQGQLYIDYPEMVTLPNIGELRIGELRNLNAIQSIPDPIQNSKSTPEATFTDVIASPLSSSRILPEVGAFR